MKISPPGAAKNDARFVSSVTAQILNEVRAGADAKKISGLKKQVALGQYDINPEEIANKIMGKK